MLHTCIARNPDTKTQNRRFNVIKEVSKSNFPQFSISTSLSQLPHNQHRQLWYLDLLPKLHATHPLPQRVPMRIKKPPIIHSPPTAPGYHSSRPISPIRSILPKNAIPMHGPIMTPQVPPCRQTKRSYKEKGKSKIPPSAIVNRFESTLGRARIPFRTPLFEEGKSNSWFQTLSRRRRPSCGPRPATRTQPNLQQRLRLHHRHRHRHRRGALPFLRGRRLRCGALPFPPPPRRHTCSIGGGGRASWWWRHRGRCGRWSGC